MSEVDVFIIKVRVCHTLVRNESFPPCLSSDWLFLSSGDFLKTLEDPDLNVRRVALVTFNSAAHNKPSLIRELLDSVLPQLYNETKVRKELIREVRTPAAGNRLLGVGKFMRLTTVLLLCRWRWDPSNTRWMMGWTLGRLRSSVCTLCWTAAWTDSTSSPSSTTWRTV